jgi:hypothetical protein
LLTLGCMIKHLNLDYSNTISQENFHLNINIIFIFIQVSNVLLVSFINDSYLYGRYVVLKKLKSIEIVLYEF